jgi:gluconolactonase
MHTAKVAFITSASVLMATMATAADPATRFGVIERNDPRIDNILPKDARLEVIADGFNWLEGPAWNHEQGYLLFSDIPANSIYRWDPKTGVSLFMKPSGYSGSEPFEGREPGSNGLTFDLDGRLVICEHGDRRIRRLDPDGSKTVLAERYQGKRLNSPNDAVYHSNGDLYFTDPPFGLPNAFDDPGKELGFSGVYRLTPEGKLDLLENRLKAPNGIAFSPDEKTLYLTDVDPQRMAWLAYDVEDDGSIRDGRVFFSAMRWKDQRAGAPDGIKVDSDGNLYGAGPEGVYIFAPDGTHLGTVFTGVPTGNLAWGEDGSTLFVTADTRVLKLRVLTSGYPSMTASKPRRTDPDRRQ